MKGNEASWDRIARGVGGLALILGGVIAIGGILGIVLAAVGLILLVTAVVGWCPIYASIRFSTKKDAEVGA
ncbi:MAG: hypothetical protein BMS9Abin17_0991 [Acidimicrobiia bacterium]|jgi:Inner membrane protein YgaP-like, transmembrane domain|nr:MAG: hypothetical protein BMS9Abin17_0991 [Acidimicrobiia bacterium]